MSRIYLQPTPLAQWYALVNEAEYSCQHELGEELESYLVFMLMRFSQRPEFSNSIVAIEFLEGIEKSGKLREISLQEVGDKCLLISGFYPEQVKRRRLKESYYIDLGQNAYYYLANNSELNIADLYKNLSNEFLSLKGILHSIRTQDNDFLTKL